MRPRKKCIKVRSSGRSDPELREATTGHPPRRRTVLVPLSELADITEYTGGIGRGYAATLPRLPDAGWDVTVLLVADSAAGEAPTDIPGITLVIRSCLLRVPPSLRPLLRALVVADASRRIPHDIVYSPEWQGAAALVSSRRPLVTNLTTGLDLIRDISGAKSAPRTLARRALEAVQRHLERLQIRRSTLVIPCSTAILRWNAEFFGKGLPPAAVVRNCIDVDTVASLAASGQLPPGWPTGHPVILFAGRLERRKGVDEAIGAFARLAEEYPEPRFVFAGATGDLRLEPTVPELLDRVPASLRHRFTFLGHTVSAHLYAAMRAADFVVCPSRWEAFGNIVLEARAAGSTVVVTRGSGFDDFCTDGEDAVMVEPGSINALASGCRRLLDDQQLRRRLLEAGVISVQAFRAEKVAGDVAAHLTRVADDHV